MISDKTNQPNAFELSLPEEIPAILDIKDTERPFSGSLLVHNVWWFCQFRWLVITVLLCYGIIGLFPQLIEPFGIRRPGFWPFTTAAILVLSNLAFLYQMRMRS